MNMEHLHLKLFAVGIYIHIFCLLLTPNFKDQFETCEFIPNSPIAFDCFFVWFHKVYIVRASKLSEDDGIDLQTSDFQGSKPTSICK